MIDFPGVDMMDQIKIIRFKDGVFEEIDDNFIEETRISVCVSDCEIAGLMALPAEAIQLGAGYLFGECYFNDPSEIESISVDPDQSRVEVAFTFKSPSPYSGKTDGFTVSSSRGMIRRLEMCPPFYSSIESVSKHPAEEVLTAINCLTNESAVFKATGAVHTAGLWIDGRFEWTSDDIGRHNAVDKTIGHALLERWPLPDNSMIVSTGRVSSDIVCKTIRARIPVLISRSAPTETSIRLAKDHGVTLIGFARENRFSIYSHPTRITRS